MNSTTRLSTGEIFDHRYTIRQLLGEGAMGRVYLAQDTLLGDQVALKVLHPGLLRCEDIYSKFLQEVRILRGIQHPNVVRTYDVSQFGSTAYFSMEFIEGTTLEEQLERSPLGIGSACHVMLQIAKGLSEIHRHNVVHRDLKPDNIILTNNGQVKLIDLGVAHVKTTQAELQEQIFGTLRYIAPELFDSAQPSPCTDMFSLGVIFYRMLTQKHPNEGNSAAQIMASYALGEITAPSKINPEIPEWVDSLIMQMVATDPKQRFSSAQPVIELLSKGLGRPEENQSRENLGFQEAGTEGDDVKISMSQDILKDGVWEVNDTLNLAIDVARSILVLHEDRQIFGGLSADTLVFDKDRKLTLTNQSLVASKITNPEFSGTLSAVELCSIPPEVWLHSDWSIQTDVYSFGTLLFHMLTGSCPFEGNSVDELIEKASSQSVPPIRSVRADLPYRLCSLVDSLTAPHKAWRPQDFEQILIILEELKYEVRSLSEVLDETGNIQVEDAIIIGLGLGKAIGEIQEDSTIFGKLSCDSVLLTKEGKLALSALTIVPECVNAPSYMDRMSPAEKTAIAPEIWMQGRWSPRADVFALGSLLFSLLTGELLYDPEQEKTQDGWEFKQFKGPKSFNSRVPTWLEELVLKMVSIESDSRPTLEESIAQLRSGIKGMTLNSEQEELLESKLFSLRELQSNSLIQSVLKFFGKTKTNKAKGIKITAPEKNYSGPKYAAPIFPNEQSNEQDTQHPAYKVQARLKFTAIALATSLVLIVIPLLGKDVLINHFSKGNVNATFWWCMAAGLFLSPLASSVYLFFTCFGKRDVRTLPATLGMLFILHCTIWFGLTQLLHFSVGAQELLQNNAFSHRLATLEFFNNIAQYLHVVLLAPCAPVVTFGQEKIFTLTNIETSLVSLKAAYPMFSIFLAIGTCLLLNRGRHTKDETYLSPIVACLPVAAETLIIIIVQEWQIAGNANLVLSIPLAAGSHVYVSLLGLGLGIVNWGLIIGYLVYCQHSADEESLFEFEDEFAAVPTESMALSLRKYKRRRDSRFSQSSSSQLL